MRLSTVLTVFRVSLESTAAARSIEHAHHQGHQGRICTNFFDGHVVFEHAVSKITLNYVHEIVDLEIVCGGRIWPWSERRCSRPERCRCKQIAAGGRHQGRDLRQRYQTDL